MQHPSLVANRLARRASGAGILAHAGGDDVSSLSRHRCCNWSGPGLLFLHWIAQRYSSIPEPHPGKSNNDPKFNELQRPR